MGNPLNLHFDYHSLQLVFVYPNIPQRLNSVFKQDVGKMNLFLIGLLGPECLLVIALGQLSSSRVFLKVFMISI